MLTNIHMKDRNNKYRVMIREYLRESIRESGYSRISVSDIAKGLGLSKKTIYRHYDSKESMYEDLFNYELEAAYNSLIILIQEKGPMAEKVNKLSKIIEKNLILLNIGSLQNIKREYYGLWKEIVLFRKNRVYPLIDLLIDHSRKNGLLEEYPNELIIELFSTSLNMAIERNSSFEVGQKYKEVFNSIFEILLNGILTKKGKKLLAINKRMKYESN